jgi:hypothetical protein
MLLVSIIILLLCVMLLLVWVLCGREFPSGHVGDSVAMRARGISCAIMQDLEAYNRQDLSDRIAASEDDTVQDNSMPLPRQ